ncbi:MAG TPA: hypothetical protein VEJ20_05715, partial [Candidatus Eremiobacteraceae bacterium]|nr:hypothetical protein [Candidatus Eremiobacteraceae bacterium]
TYSADSYTAAQVEAEAIRRLMSRNGGVPPSREDVVHEIATSTFAATPLGSIAFTHEGDVTTPVVSIWTIKNGQYVFLSQQKKAL